MKTNIGMAGFSALKHIHVAVRLIGSAYLVGFFGWNLVKYYRYRRGLYLKSKNLAESLFLKGRRIKIYYGSQSGMTKDLSLKVHDQLCRQYPCNLVDFPLSISKLQDLEDLIKDSQEDSIHVFLVSTFVDGEEPGSCKWLYQSLKDSSDDFRVSKSILSHLVYAICGVGDTAYKENFCKAALTLSDYLQKLGAKAVSSPKLVDISAEDLPEAQVTAWAFVLSRLIRGLEVNAIDSILPYTKPPSDHDSPHHQSDGSEEASGDDDKECSDSETDDNVHEDPTSLPDIEDLALNEKKVGQTNGINGHPNRNIVKKFNLKKDKIQPVDYTKFTKEQINERLRKDLTKQGYKLIQSHSAVKLCRWTKHAMRGRGGCYKHTFYGIQSYQCMEMTPNLACASKCTFCWRHHKNPVGTEWKWKMDDPEIIVSQGIESHQMMIKGMRGVPGVLPERFNEAMTVRHCALSLVGEPIFYPKINELLDLLHQRSISSFLVTNAQFPEAMRNLVPVTQLYVSIDASNKDSLKKIDRPLYQDFWQRFLDCLQIISEKEQRTVFRLTLVKRMNVDEIEGYSKLIRLGKPDFIEIKGVTYCGTSKSNTLTMDNVPWHEEVVEFSRQLVNCLPKGNYELACEHEHSNCTLIASTKFKVNGKWHTWIDYEKFFELLKESKTRDKGFSSLDYMMETPMWAIFDSEHHGFDPKDERFYRNKNKRNLANIQYTKPHTRETLTVQVS